MSEVNYYYHTWIENISNSIELEVTPDITNDNLNHMSITLNQNISKINEEKNKINENNYLSIISYRRNNLLYDDQYIKYENNWNLPIKPSYLIYKSSYDDIQYNTNIEQKIICHFTSANVYKNNSDTEFYIQKNDVISINNDIELEQDIENVNLVLIKYDDITKIYNYPYYLNESNLVRNENNEKILFNIIPHNSTNYNNNDYLYFKLTDSNQQHTEMTDTVSTGRKETYVLQKKREYKNIFYYLIQLI